MKKIVAVLVVSAFLAGCTGCAAGPYKAIRSGPDNIEISSSVVVLDKRMAAQFGSRKVVVMGERKSRTPDGRLELQCDIRNMKNEFLMMQIQTVFRNAAGLVVEETAWELIEVPAFVTITYGNAASTPEASEYTIRIRSEK